MKKVIYLDYNATTPLATEVSTYMCDVLTSVWGNPSSGYTTGLLAKQTLEKAREKIAEMVGSSPLNITFTSGGTEANNMVIFGMLHYFDDWQGKQSIGSIAADAKPHIITTNVEHDSILLPIKYLQERGIIDATFIPVSSDGSVPVNSLLPEIRPTTCLVSVMLANNETGVVMPVEILSRKLKGINKERASQNLIKILFHTDAAQAIGKIPVNVEDLQVDYLTVVGHKFYGPRGGCLFAREPVYPMMFGGKQERGLRPGTENVAVAAALGVASQLVTENLTNYTNYFLQITQFLEAKLKEEFQADIKINFRSGIDVLPNTCSVTFTVDDIIGSELLHGCRRVEASVGAACHTGSKPSAVLIASGLSENEARRTLRLSVGRDTTKDDILAAVADLRQSFNALRNVNGTEK